jgi:hypothetical protein
MSDKCKTYYHGTTPDYAKSILNNGFVLTDNDSSQFKGERDFDRECLYAFTNLDDAIDFICNQGHNKQAVISFTVTADTDVIPDTEYDSDEFDNNAVILFGDYFNTDNEKIVWVQ